MQEMRTEMNTRFDAVDAKLLGIENQFEYTNELRINDIGIIADKVSKLEKELYLLKKQ